MLKVVNSESYDTRKASKARGVFKTLTATALTLVIMATSVVPTKAAEVDTKKYLYVKQPEVVGNYYYQYHWSDWNWNGRMDQSEIICDKFYIDNTCVVAPQTNANVYAVSENAVEYGWHQVGEYNPEVHGYKPSVDDASNMLVARQIGDGEKYVMRKLPEMINDGRAVRWYYWEDKDQDFKTDKKEFEYYDIPVYDELVVPAQADANVFAYSDTMFVDGWEVVGHYDAVANSTLRSVDEVNGYIAKHMVQGDIKYVVRKLPEMINDGHAVRWYYWRDKDADTYVDNAELVYYDVPVFDDGVIPAQPNANVIAVSDKIEVPGWEVIGIYDETLHANLRNVSKVDSQIDKNEKKSVYRLVYLPNFE